MIPFRVNAIKIAFTLKNNYKKSDVAAYNIYYLMRKSNNGDIWESMMVYNEGVSKGSINGSEEFLAHFGNGDPVQGMEELKKELDRETNGTRLLSGIK